MSEKMTIKIAEEAIKMFGENRSRYAKGFLDCADRMKPVVAALESHLIIGGAGSCKAANCDGWRALKLWRELEGEDGGKNG